MINIRNTFSKIIQDNDQKASDAFFDYFYLQLFDFSLQYVKLPSIAQEVVSDVI